MRITLCSSAIFAQKAYNIKDLLEAKGHEVFVYPSEVDLGEKTVSVEKYYELRKSDFTKDLLKIKKDLIHKHIEKIENSDAILVLNFDKDGSYGYIGGNTFLEMSIAFYLNKRIYLWKMPSEKLPYYEEILPMNPVSISEDISRIPE